MTIAQTSPSAADLRAELARRRVRIFEAAAAIGLHPVTLGRMLNERRPLPDEVARRLAEVLDGDVRDLTSR